MKPFSPLDSPAERVPIPHRCLSVVMPCFNEEGTVQEAVRAVLESPYVGELVVVDDGSTDKTAEIVERIDDPRLRLRRQPVNLGKGAALQRGFLEVSCPYVIIQDADLEYDPTEYGRLLTPLVADKADVVYGSRFLSAGGHRVLYYWHSVGNHLLTLASNVMTNLNLTDMETCYKAFRREVVDALELEEDRFGIEPELTAKIAAGGWRVWEVGISYAGRTYAEGKKIGVKDAVRAAYCVARYSRPGQRLARSRARRRGLATEGEIEDALHESLEDLGERRNYAEWLAGHVRALARPGRLHEVGAGTGTMSEVFAEWGPLTASELSETAVERLRERFADRADVEVIHGDLTRALASARTADTVVLVNVLEHIEDDIGALRQIHDALPPGGRVVLVVPAFESLYAPFDRAVGHHRRYRRAALINRIAAAGFDVVDARYVNTVGAILWFAYARVLGRVPTRTAPAATFDRVLVPVLRRLEDGRQLALGQSIVAAGERPADAEPAGSPGSEEALTARVG